MSDFTSSLPARPSLEQLRKQAKELLRHYRDGDTTAAERFRVASPRLADSDASAGVTLADAQFVLAREYGFDSWAKLVRHVEATQPSSLEHFEELAKDLLAAWDGDPDALHRFNERHPRALTRDELRALVEERLGTQIASFTLADAQLLVARQLGFSTWALLAASAAKPSSDPRAGVHGLSATPPFYLIDWNENRIEPRQPLSEKDWETVLSVMKEADITGLNARGQMTDTALERLSKHDRVTYLDLDGSKRLTDDGLQHLARMPQLQHLDLTNYPGGTVTDRGLEFLRHLPELRSFQMGWQRGISDAGVANLTFCDQLESVNLMGTATGDGAIKALAGKPKLRHFRTGRQVTDDGLPLLHQFPVFKTWQGGQLQYDLVEAEVEPNQLLLDGPFTDVGLGSIVGLDGVFGLHLFWHTSALTPDGLAPLGQLANLGYLGCERELCNDDAMRHIAAMPKLRALMCQDTVAGDEGFTALSQSKTIESVWGRRCYNLEGRGFAAMTAMPALRGLSVSCKNVDDPGLSALPRFPALEHFMPMDVPDDGFRHVGRCEQLEALTCMYCSDTGDTATGHIAGLSKLRTYYASSTQITDRSLEILGRMPSLERLTFERCGGITDAGIAVLARLPRLRELNLDELPRVTRESIAVFPAHVRVNWHVSG